MLDFIKNKLMERHNGSPINLVKIRGGSEKKFLIFAFLNKETNPFACLKAPSLDAHSCLIRQEFDNLKNAKNILPDNLKNTLPSLYEPIIIEGKFISCEEAVKGIPDNRDNNKKKLENIFKWVCQFHKSGIVGKMKFSKSSLIEIIFKHKDCFKKFDDNNLYFQKKVVNFVDKIWPHGEIVLPIINQHGDFHHGNIFFQKNRLKVIDWANYSKVLLPAYDLFFYLKRQNCFVENHQFFYSYFNFFSLPSEIIPSWIKILNLVDGLEKASLYNEITSNMAEEYFKEILV